MTTVKGLLKGLRYISQIFENEKEAEMQIGFPTDVKHVAHIGNEGSATNNPSWMNKYQGEASSGAPNCNGKIHDNQTTKSSAKDSTVRTIESNAPLESPTRPNSSKTKQSGRHAHTSSNGLVSSMTREPLAISKPRRYKNTGLGSPGRQKNSSVGSESHSHDPNVALKSGRRKKTKGGLSGEGSTRSRSRLSDPKTQSYPYSDPGAGYDRDSGDVCQKSILEKYEDGKECEEISRGIRGL